MEPTMAGWVNVPLFDQLLEPCAGADASKGQGGPCIELGADAELRHDGMSAIVSSMDGKLMHGFSVQTKQARSTNSYICNETHWRALRALQYSEQYEGRLRAAFFVHIPSPAVSATATASEIAQHQKGLDISSNTDYKPLARGVAALITQLVDQGIC